ncbi:MAG TPA: acyl-CoA dehydrogenase family protein, partial [Microthrixaceae bacterium]|nr:acyl-CoA dehydrogenase family protein [Microthrixaceae bacterium]
MSIAINEDHVALADTVAAFLTQRGSLTEARARLDGAPEALPDFWGELAGLGWLGLHLGEDVGGSGFGLEELVVVAEQTGRALMPGPFLPTVIASAAVQSAGTDEQRARLLPGLADGSVTAAVALDGDVTVSDGKASGFVRTAVGAGIADLLLVPAGSDVVVVTLRDSGPAADPVAGVSIEVPDNL